MSAEQPSEARFRLRVEAESRRRPARSGAVARARGLDDDAAGHQCFQMAAHRPPACLAAFGQLGGRRLACFGQAANQAEPHGVGDTVEQTCWREELGGFHGRIKLGTGEGVKQAGKVKKN